MADEFQLGNNTNWWDSSRTSRFDESAQTPSSSAALMMNSNSTSSFGWPTQMVDIKAATRRSSVDSLSVSASSMFLSHDTQNIPPSASQDSSSDPNLQIMGLGLSSQNMDWNQQVFRDEKAENSSFRSMLQEGMSSNTYFHHQDSVVQPAEDHWRPKLYAANDPSTKQSDIQCRTGSPSILTHQHQRGFSLDQPYNNTAAAATNFPVDASTAVYGNHSMFQGGLLASETHHQQLQQQPPSSYQGSYGSLDSGELMMPQPNVSKFPQFLVRGNNSPPKQENSNVGQLHFSNSAPFWNATAAAMNDVRSSFFPPLQTQLPTPTFDEKQKNTSEEVRNLGAIVKKPSNEATNKRPRNESSSPLPAFKVRKEKMGDRITALQQLVSPFGKTDTASVLSEAIEYIKFLHEQVNVLSTPYLRSGASLQNQQVIRDTQSIHYLHHRLYRILNQHNDNKARDPEAQKQDLRSRGLCLVPVSSTFPVTHETTVDFWTPTFGGTFR